MVCAPPLQVLAAQQVAAQISAQANATRQAGGIQLSAGARVEQNALAVAQPGGPVAHNPLVAAAQAVAAQIANQASARPARLLLIPGGAQQNRCLLYFTYI